MDDINIKIPDPVRQKKINPIGKRFYGLSTAHVFALFTLVLVAKFEWPRRWLISGAPVLTCSLLLGAANGNRFLPFIPLWPFLTTLNLVYAIASTSWLLYWIFLLGCYPTILLASMFQFDPVSNFVRRRLRKVVKDSHFLKDKIALFNLPALEIDTEVQGLFVIRGVTLSLSSLTIVAHGVEVAIKLMDDMELAIITDKVTVSLFRKIEIDDIYANLKGGEFEMTFIDLSRDDDTTSATGDGVGAVDSEIPSAILRAATMSVENVNAESLDEPGQQKSSVSRKQVPPKNAPVKEGLELVETLSPDDDAHATTQYDTAIKHIMDSSAVTQCRKNVLKSAQNHETETSFSTEDDKQVRASICARLHDKSSIPHPPQKAIKVSAIRKMSNPRTNKFLHRLPMLLRLLLNPLSYFHPIKISSITVGGSGKWIQYLLQTHVFKEYTKSSADIRRLEARVNSYLSSANFMLQLNDLVTVAHVPFITTYDIEARLAIADVIVCRTLPEETSLSQSVRLHGADASVAIPTCLLPHHEHLLPPKPSEDKESPQCEKTSETNSLGDTKVEDISLEVKDETQIKLSARVRLPAVFDQQILDFIAALVKATKLIEVEKSLEDVEAEKADENSDSDDSSISTISRRSTGLKNQLKAFGKTVNTGMEKTWRKGVVGGIANDRWIAKLVGKVTKMLETVRGDVGYSGDFPVPLEGYRLAGEGEASKILG